MSKYLSIQEACKWATSHIGKNVTNSNISYLINYGRIRNHGKNGDPLIDEKELIHYYESFLGNREENWKKKLGNDLNWNLSFENYKESETTKHVHRLHPYKGKFIPQLVEYFLDDHIDKFKKEVFFNKGDIVLDPFCGSGTTLVQANELGINAIGIDISHFNAVISNVKVGKYDLPNLKIELDKITKALQQFLNDKNTSEFERLLLDELNKFNTEFFPSPDFRYKVRHGEINEKQFGKIKSDEFLTIYKKLIEKYQIKLKQKNADSFIDKWYLQVIREEIDFVFELVKNIQDSQFKKIVSVILSRTIRSCRATTHSDLATLIEPICETYYCKKHGKICKPLFSILGWWKRYSNDTLKRLVTFNNLRTESEQICLIGDSRKIDIYTSLQKNKFDLFNLVKKNKINGIFSSPPYVGLIDYHEQHAYAYDLFGYSRKDSLEIGPLFKGQGKEARKSYVSGISSVLNQCKKFMNDDYNIFLVANDKYNLYPTIAEKSGMKIINQYKRPVLNRTEKDKTAYSESIFHLKEE